MIKAKKAKIHIEGELFTILTEFAMIKKSVIKLLKDNKLDHNHILNEIDNSIVFANLEKSGMSKEEALEIMGKSTDFPDTKND